MITADTSARPAGRPDMARNPSNGRRRHRAIRPVGRPDAAGNLSGERRRCRAALPAGRLDEPGIAGGSSLYVTSSDTLNSWIYLLDSGGLFRRRESEVQATGLAPRMAQATPAAFGLE